MLGLKNFCRIFDFLLGEYNSKGGGTRICRRILSLRNCDFLLGEYNSKGSGENLSKNAKFKKFCRIFDFLLGEYN